ncbi:MAG: VTT domain-containing protein [Patescibacteria group bacterium]|nr:VTT domain-containing protein [Patescibacteria group bacterium]
MKIKFTKKNGIILLLLFTALLGLYFFWPDLRFSLSDINKVRETIQGFGIWGPIALIAFSAFQVVLWPVPGYVPVVIGSYLYGFLLGFLYSLIGINIGTFIVLYLTRKYGRPFAEKFVSKKTLAKWDKFFEGRGPVLFFLTYLVPGFPDDLITYVAGLTNVPIITLLLISIVARAPQNLIIAYFGEAISFGNLERMLLPMALIILIGIIGLLNERKLTILLTRFGKKHPIE